MGTFPCNRHDCRTSLFVNSNDNARTTNGQINISGHYLCIKSQLVYCIPCLKCSGIFFIGETGHHLGDSFHEHLLEITNKKVALSVLEHFAKQNHQLSNTMVAVIKTGLGNPTRQKHNTVHFQLQDFGTRGFEPRLWLFVMNLCASLVCTWLFSAHMISKVFLKNKFIFWISVIFLFVF